MEKPTPASDSEQSASHNAVFVDTSLSTHLAVLVSDSDTVSDLKKKILHEHPLCFPKIGEIEIHALKVKRRGHFYHLSETMLVRSAFVGVNKNWFITVDASRRADDCNGDQSLDNILLATCGGCTGNNLACQQVCKSLCSLKQDESNQCVKQKVPVDDLQIVEILKRGVEYLGHDHGMIASLDTNNSLSLDILEQLDRRIKEKEVQIVEIVRQEEVLKETGSGDVEGSGAFDGASETEPHLKKKSKSKKRKHFIHNLDSKEDNISVDESSRNKLDLDTTASEISLGHGGGIVSSGIQMGVKSIADGPRMLVSSDANKTSAVIEKGIDALNLGTEVSREYVKFKDVQRAESLKDTSQFESPAKQKHKTENKKGDNQKSKNSSANGVTAETLEGVHLQSAFPSSPQTKGGRRSTHKSSDLPEEAVASPSPKTNVGIESSRDEVAADAKIWDQDLDAVSLPAQHAQHVMPFEQFACLPKENNHDSLQELHQRASQDICLSEVDAGNTENRHDCSKIVTVSAAEQIGCKSPNAAEVVPHSSLVTKESNNIEKDVGLSVLENNYETPTSEQAYEVENDGEVLKHISPKIMLPTELQPCGQAEIGTSEHLDTGENLEPKESSKKRRKSHKTRGLLSETQAMSGTEHGEHHKSNIPANEPDESVNADHTKFKGNNAKSTMPPKKGKEVSEKDRVSTSLLAMDREFNKTIPNVVESAQRTTKNQANAENIDGKSKKKSKRKQSSDLAGPPFDEAIPNVVESAPNRKQSSDPDCPLFDEPILNVVESTRQKTENQENAENIDGKAKKKSKRKQSSDPHCPLFDEAIPNVVESAPKRKQCSYPDGPLFDDAIPSVVKNIDGKSKKKSKRKQSSDPVGPLSDEAIPNVVENIDGKSKKKSKRKQSSDSVAPLFDEAIPNVVESAQQKTENQGNAESIDGKSKNKSKRKQSSDADSCLKLQSKIEDVGHKAPDMDKRKDDPSTDKVNDRESNIPLDKDITEKDRINVVIQNVVDSAQQRRETQVNARNADRKSRKKSKAKQSSDSKSQPKIQFEIEDVGHKAPDMSTGKVDCVTDKANNEESNMPLKKGKEVWEKDSVSTSPFAADRELDKGIQNTVEFAQQKGETQVHTENVDQKSRKKSKRKQTSNPKIQSKLQSEIEDVGHKSSDVDIRVVDSSTDKFHNGESDVSLISGKALSDLDMSNSSLLATDKEIVDIINNVMESVQQMSETEVNGDNVNRKSREKTKEKRSPVSSIDNTKEVDSSSKLMWRAHLTNKSSPNQLHGSNSVHEQDFRAENEDLGAQLNSTAIESSLTQVHELEGNIERRDLGNANVNEQKRGHADESPTNMEATCGSNGINFSDYFVPKWCHHETFASGEVLVAEKTKAMGAVNEKKAKHNKPLLGHSGSGVKAPQSSKSDELNSIAEGAKRHVKASGSSTYTKTNREIFSTSNSLGSPKSRNLQNKSVAGHQWHEVHIDVGKASAISATKAGEVVNSSRHGKSLIGTSGAIFNDDSCGSSADEDVVDNSGSSTRTPLDKSMTSDSTDGESDIDFNSPQNGSDSLKRKEDVAKSIRSSGITLDTILRSSSRYKNAKLRASQSQLEETESQPVDFVPDSQANY